MAGDHDNNEEPSPWFKSLYDYYKHMSTAKKKRGYNRKSDSVLRLFQRTDCLHVIRLKPEAQPDQLLRLHMLLHAIPVDGANTHDSVPSTSILVIADSNNADTDGYSQAFWTIKQHVRHAETGVSRVIFDGSGYVFSKRVVLIRGVTQGSGHSNAIKRIQTSLQILAKENSLSGAIWHECVSISLLNVLVNNVQHWQKAFGRSPLAAVVVANGLSMDRDDLRACTALPDKATTSSFLGQLGSLGIPVLFVDAFMLGITSRLDHQASSLTERYYHRSTFLPSFNENFPCLVPSAVYQPLLKSNMDSLAVHIMRLAAKHNGNSGSEVVDVTKQLFHTPRSAWWANRILKEDAFSSQKCGQSAGTHLLNAIVNSDAPLDFKLGSFPCATLDPGCDTSNMMALSCELDCDEIKLRLNLKPRNGNHIYILASRSTRAVINQLRTNWTTTVKSLVPVNSIPIIETSTSKYWLHLAGRVTEQLTMLLKSEDFKKLEANEQQLIKLIYWQILNGSMGKLPSILAFRR